MYCTQWIGQALALAAECRALDVPYSRVKLIIISQARPHAYRPDQGTLTQMTHACVQFWNVLQRRLCCSRRTLNCWRKDIIEWRVIVTSSYDIVMTPSLVTLLALLCAGVKSTSAGRCTWSWLSVAVLRGFFYYTLHGTIRRATGVIFGRFNSVLRRRSTSLESTFCIASSHELCRNFQASSQNYIYF